MLITNKPILIDWKSEERNLCKKHPRVAASGQAADEVDDGEDFDGDFGSFFHWFTSKTDDFGVSLRSCMIVRLLTSIDRRTLHERDLTRGCRPLPSCRLV